MGKRLRILLLTIAWAPAAMAADADSRSLVSNEQILQAANRQFEKIDRASQRTLDRNFEAKATCIAKALLDAIPPEKAMPDLAWSIHVYESREPNASALPSGQVLVLSGLAGVANGADELASAIATPVGAVLLRQSQKSLNRRALARVQLMSNPDPTVQQMALERREAAAVQADVLEADALGRELMTRAGFDPQGQLTFFEALSAARSARSDALLQRMSAARTWLEGDRPLRRTGSKPCALLQ